MAVSAELHRQLLHVFQLCDTENKGCVTVQHLQELGRQHYLTDKNIKQLVELLDPGGSGVVSFDGFCNGVSTIMQLQGLQSECIEDCQLDVDYHKTDNPVEMREFERLSPIRRSVRRGGSSSRSLLQCQVDNKQAESGPHSLDLPMEIQDSSKGDNGIPSTCSSCTSDREQNFECLGEGDELDPESAQPHSLDYGLIRHSSPSNFNRRNSWLRSSLRRSPTTTRRHLVNSACAGSLHRSASFTSSGRGSAGDVEDRCSDNSLEDDVMDLSQKVQMLQQQVSALAETQSSTDDRYSRVRQENAGLQARIQMLEEQLREAEGRGDLRLQDEQRRNREIISRVEREKLLENENMAIKLKGAETETRNLEEEVLRLKTTNERIRVEKDSMNDQINELQYQITSLREESRRMEELGRREKEQLQREAALNIQLLEELTRELEVLRKTPVNNDGRDSPDGGDGLEQRYSKLQVELQALRKEIKALKENNEELQAQLLTHSLEEGRHLLSTRATNSLAAEFEEMGQQENGKTMEDLKQKLVEQQECNSELRAYIDGILLNIVENYPQLLEVKNNK